MAEKLIGRGQYTLVNLHDGKSMQVYLHNNRPIVQFHSRTDNTFTPNYVQKPVTITPELYFDKSQKNQIAHVKKVVWTINGKSPDNYGGVPLTNPLALKITKNLTSANQLLIAFTGVVEDPDTHLETKIASQVCISRQDTSDITPILQTTYPNGSVFRNFTHTSLSAICELKLGAKDVSKDAQYKWYQLIDKEYQAITDKWVIAGYNTNTLKILKSQCEKEMCLKCEATYNGKKYIQHVTFSKKTDPFVCQIETVGGDKMHNGQGEIICKAHVYQGGKMMPDKEAESRFTFCWKKYNRLTGTQDKSWKPKYTRIITVNSKDISKLSTFVCELQSGGVGI